MGVDSFGLSAADPADALTAAGLGDRPFFALNVRIGYYARPYAQYIEQLARVSSAVADRLGVRILMVPIALGDIDSDVVSGKQLVNAIRGRDVAVVPPDYRTAAVTKGILGRAVGALGVSYHFSLFALQQGVPSVMLYGDDYYRQKALGIAKLWNDDRLALSIVGKSGALKVRWTASIESALDHLEERK